MFRRRSVVRPENRRVAQLVMIAFVLLALGDTGHVGFRVASYAMGDPAPQFYFLVMLCWYPQENTLNRSILIERKLSLQFS